MNNNVKQILKNVQNGTLSVEDAVLKLKKSPFQDIGYAKVDSHRALRQGVAEIIYGAGKTPEQIIGIVDTMKSNGQNTVLITRLDEQSVAHIQTSYSLDYHSDAKIGVLGDIPKPYGIGKIVVAT